MKATRTFQNNCLKCGIGWEKWLVSAIDVKESGRIMDLPVRQGFIFGI
jgi:hypothetical protein